MLCVYCIKVERGLYLATPDKGTGLLFMESGPMECPIIFLLRQTSGTETILDIRFCEEVFYRVGKTNAFIYKLHFFPLMIFYN